MLLSELKRQLPHLQVARDGAFQLTSKLGSYFTAAEGILSFITSKDYLPQLTKEVTSIVTTAEILPYLPDEMGVIIAEDPRSIFSLLHNVTAARQLHLFNKNGHAATSIGKNCSIHQSAVIAEKNVRIGNNVTIGANVVINEQVEIGDDCQIYGGAVIGDNGFEYCKIDNKMTLVQHLGKVRIGNNVHIHPNTCIAKALFVNDTTEISENVVIDCLVYIAHGVKIAANAIIAAGSVIGGSSVIGEEVFLGLNSSIKQLCRVDSQAAVGMGSVVISGAGENQIVAGNPARVIHK